MLEAEAANRPGVRPWAPSPTPILCWSLCGAGTQHPILAPSPSILGSSRASLSQDDRGRLVLGGWSGEASQRRRQLRLSRKRCSPREGNRAAPLSTEYFSTLRLGLMPWPSQPVVSHVQRQTWHPAVAGLVTVPDRSAQPQYWEQQVPMVGDWEGPGEVQVRPSRVAGGARCGRERGSPSLLCPLAPSQVGRGWLSALWACAGPPWREAAPVSPPSTQAPCSSRLWASIGRSGAGRELCSDLEAAAKAVAGQLSCILQGQWVGPPGRGEEAAGLGTAVGSRWVAAGRVCGGGNLLGEGVSRGSLRRQRLPLFPRLLGRGGAENTSLQPPRPPQGQSQDLAWWGSLLWASSEGRKGLTGRMRVSGGLGSSLPPPPPPRAFPAGVGDLFNYSYKPPGEAGC